MAATMLNGSAGTDTNGSSSPMLGSAKSSKQSFANKVIDGGRKQVGSSIDGPQR